MAAIFQNTFLTITRIVFPLYELSPVSLVYSVSALHSFELLVCLDMTEKERHVRQSTDAVSQTLSYTNLRKAAIAMAEGRGDWHHTSSDKKVSIINITPAAHGYYSSLHGRHVVLQTFLSELGLL